MYIYIYVCVLDGEQDPAADGDGGLAPDHVLPAHGLHHVRVVHEPARGSCVAVFRKVDILGFVVQIRQLKSRNVRRQVSGSRAGTHRPSTAITSSPMRSAPEMCAGPPCEGDNVLVCVWDSAGIG